MSPRRAVITVDGVEVDAVAPDEGRALVSRAAAAVREKGRRAAPPEPGLKISSRPAAAAGDPGEASPGTAIVSQPAAATGGPGPGEPGRAITSRPAAASLEEAPHLIEAQRRFDAEQARQRQPRRTAS